MNRPKSYFLFPPCSTVRVHGRIGHVRSTYHPDAKEGPQEGEVAVLFESGGTDEDEEIRSETCHYPIEDVELLVPADMYFHEEVEAEITWFWTECRVRFPAVASHLVRLRARHNFDMPRHLRELL